MAPTALRLDPDRYRRRLRLLADTRAVRERLAIRRANLDRIQHLVASRRRGSVAAPEIR